MHCSFLFLLPLKLPKRFMSCSMRPRSSSCRSCPVSKKKLTALIQRQREGQGKVSPVPNAHVRENKTPGRPCGYKKRAACWKFSLKVLGCSLGGERLPSRMAKPAGEALPALIPVLRSCLQVAADTGRGSKSAQPAAGGCQKPQRVKQHFPADQLMRKGSASAC